MHRHNTPEIQPIIIHEGVKFVPSLKNQEPHQPVIQGVNNKRKEKETGNLFVQGLLPNIVLGLSFVVCSLLFINGMYLIKIPKHSFKYSFS